MTKDEAIAAKQNHQVLSHTYRPDDLINVRICADHAPDPSFVSAPAEIQDVYFAHLYGYQGVAV